MEGRMTPSDRNPPNFDLPSAEERAYEAARTLHEGEIESLVEQAVDAHDRGDDEQADKLMAEARALSGRGVTLG
jgi:hypothetical protein